MPNLLVVVASKLKKVRQLIVGSGPEKGAIGKSRSYQIGQRVLYFLSQLFDCLGRASGISHDGQEHSHTYPPFEGSLGDRQRFFGVNGTSCDEACGIHDRKDTDKPQSKWLDRVAGSLNPSIEVPVPGSDEWQEMSESVISRSLF